MGYQEMCANCSENRLPKNFYCDLLYSVSQNCFAKCYRYDTKLILSITMMFWKIDGFLLVRATYGTPSSERLNDHYKTFDNV